MHLLPIKHKATSRKKWGISWNLFRYQKYVIATRCVTESCAKATSLCLQIVELFDVTSKYNIFFLHTKLLLSRFDVQHYFAGRVSTRELHFQVQRNTTRAKLRLSYAIEFIIIHNLSYFFSFLAFFSLRLLFTSSFVFIFQITYIFLFIDCVCCLNNGNESWSLSSMLHIIPAIEWSISPDATYDDDDESANSKCSRCCCSRRAREHQRVPSPMSWVNRRVKLRKTFGEF